LGQPHPGLPPAEVLSTLAGRWPPSEQINAILPLTIVRFTLVALLFASCGGGSLQAQTGVCDPHLPQPANDPDGYRMRGDRCEGIYIREVAGSSAVLLVSLTRSALDYDLKSGKDLAIDWQSPSTQGPVRLRGVGLRQRLYYQMDTTRPAGATTYIWNTGVLANLKLKPDELGVLAWISTPVGPQTRDVYLPLGVSQERSAGAGYRLTLSPSAELSEVYVTLAPIGADGRAKPALPALNGKKLGFGYYPALRAFSFPVPNPGVPGIYMLDVSAILKTGEPSTMKMWFYHSGK
jgi:hypothetical protein